MTATKTTPTATTAIKTAAGNLVNTGLVRGGCTFLWTGGGLTLAALKAVEGETLALESVEAGEVKTYRVAEAVYSREFDSYTLWLVDAKGIGRHGAVHAA